ncbi:universal stress protein [Pelomyxa schiedti]|nr:universal stress protein [Pelomyxa schiedti]
MFISFTTADAYNTAYDREKGALQPVCIIDREEGSSSAQQQQRQKLDPPPPSEILPHKVHESASRATPLAVQGLHVLLPEPGHDGLQSEEQLPPQKQDRTPPSEQLQHKIQESTSRASRKPAAVPVANGCQVQAPQLDRGGVPSEEEHALLEQFPPSAPALQHVPRQQHVLLEPGQLLPTKDPLVRELEDLGYVVEQFENIKFNRQGKKLGEGAYGTVLQATLWGNPVAIKILKPETTNEKYLQEINLLRRGTGKNVVHLQGVCVHEGKRIMILEWMHTDLWELLYGSKDNLPKPLQAQWGGDGWPLPIKIKLGLTLSRGVYWLKKHAGIVHRDLKPGNCLVDARFNIKVADFGTGKRFPFSFNDEDMPGTYQYLCPEVMKSGLTATTFQLDVYAVGLLLYELLAEKQVFTKYFKNITDWNDPRAEKARQALYADVISGVRPRVPEIIPKGPNKGQLTPRLLNFLVSLFFFPFV